MNSTKKNLHWYDSHLGALYFDKNFLSVEELYCDSCGDYDDYINNWSTWKDAYLGLVKHFSEDPEDFKDDPENYDPDYCMYDKKYICEGCNAAYGPISMEDFIDIENLKDKKVLINVRQYSKDFCEGNPDDYEGIFSGYFVVENGKYLFDSKEDSEEWDDLWNIPIIWFEEYHSEKSDKKYDKTYIICFNVGKEEKVNEKT